MKKYSAIFGLIAMAATTVVVATTSAMFYERPNDFVVYGFEYETISETAVETEITETESESCFSLQETESESVIETEVESETEIETETQKMFSEEEEVMLQKIAWVEAGNCSVESMAIVMRVVMNRVESDHFPNTIEEVIMQNEQFTPVTTGVYFSAEPNEKTKQALELFESGYDGVYGATFFSTERSEWHKRTLTEVCRKEGIIYWTYDWR